MVKLDKCCCFSIETGGVIIATWNAIQMLCVIFALLTNIPHIRHSDGVTIFVAFTILVISVAVICISLLSIKGIENRNHRFILPMLIWLFVALILQLIFSVITLRIIFEHSHIRVDFVPILLIFTILSIVLAVLSILVFYSLFTIFKKEPRRRLNARIYQQRFLSTDKGESNHQNC